MGILISLATIVVLGLIIFLIAFIATRGGDTEYVEKENLQTIVDNNKESYLEKEELIATTGLKVLCFFVPLVGLSIYSNNISFNRKFANDCGKSALISFLIGVGISVVVFVITLIITISNLTGI